MGEARQEVTNAKLLEAFDDLRIADIRDGMDWVGYHLYGSMDPSIRPLWRTRAVGIARTARYLPYQGPVPHVEADDYLDWVGWYYREVCSYPWQGAIQQGEMMVIDASGVADGGLIGSENSLGGLRRGLRGYITNGAVRDSDESVLQKVPIWSASIAQSMVQARLQFDATDVPVAVGGVVVYPGDVVAADGDGVIVVPRKVALDVARYAHAEHRRDKATRKKHYEALGRALDDTVA